DGGRPADGEGPGIEFAAAGVFGGQREDIIILPVLGKIELESAGLSGTNIGGGDLTGGTVGMRRCTGQPPGEMASVEVGIKKAVLHGENAVEGIGDLVGLEMYGAPNLFDGVEAAFLLPIGAEDAIGTMVFIGIELAIAIYPDHGLIREIPEEAAGGKRIVPYEFPIII